MGVGSENVELMILRGKEWGGWWGGARTAPT